MKFFSPKPKKLLMFKERVLKVWKNKQKNRLKEVSYDVFFNPYNSKAEENSSFETHNIPF